MAEVQSTGDTKKLGMNPVPQPPSGRGKGGQTQIIGSSITLSRNPVDAAPSLAIDGRVSTTGEKVTLNTNPIKGLGSAASLPMSKRAEEQSR